MNKVYKLAVSLAAMLISVTFSVSVYSSDGANFIPVVEKEQVFTSKGDSNFLDKSTMVNSIRTFTKLKIIDNYDTAVMIAEKSIITSTGCNSCHDKLILNLDLPDNPSRS